MAYRVLAVDEDPKSLLTIKYYIDMEQDDVEFFTANTYAEALKIFKDKAPHLVVTELNLPDGDGKDMVLKMRKINPLFNSIIQTTITDPNFNITTQRTLRSIDFLCKPLDQELFTDAFNFARERTPKPKEEIITIVQGNSNITIRVAELLGGEMVKSEAKLLLYVYKLEIGKLRTIQLMDMTLIKFLRIANKYTDAIVQCQKSYFVNKERIQKLDSRATPAELVMEFGDVKIPVGQKFINDFRIKEDD